MMNVDITQLSPSQLKAMVEAGLISIGGQAQTQPQPQPQPQSSNPDLNLAEQYMERRFGARFKEIEECKSPIDRLVLVHRLFKDIVSDIRRLAGWEDTKKYSPQNYNIGLRWGMEVSLDWWNPEDGKKDLMGTRVRLSGGGLKSFGLVGGTPYPLIEKICICHHEGSPLDEDTKDAVKNGVFRMRKAFTYLIANEGTDKGCLFFAKPQKGKAYDRTPIENCPGVRKRMMDMSVVSRPSAPEGVSVGNKLCV